MLISRVYKENIGVSKLRKNVSWVRFPVKMVFVARKLSTLQGRRQDQSCLFPRKELWKRKSQPLKLPWIRFPVKKVSVAKQISTTGEHLAEESGNRRTTWTPGMGFEPVIPVLQKPHTELPWGPASIYMKRFYWN